MFPLKNLARKGLIFIICSFTTPSHLLGGDVMAMAEERWPGRGDPVISRRLLVLVVLPATITSKQLESHLKIYGQRPVFMGN